MRHFDFIVCGGNVGAIDRTSHDPVIHNDSAR